MSKRIAIVLLKARGRNGSYAAPMPPPSRAAAAAGGARCRRVALRRRREHEPGAERLGRLVHGHARAVGGDLEQHPAGLAEVDRAEVGAVHHRRHADPEAGEGLLPRLLGGVVGRAEGDVVHVSDAVARPAGAGLLEDVEEHRGRAAARARRRAAAAAARKRVRGPSLATRANPSCPVSSGSVAARLASKSVTEWMPRSACSAGTSEPAQAFAGSLSPVPTISRVISSGSSKRSTGSPNRSSSTHDSPAADRRSRQNATDGAGDGERGRAHLSRPGPPPVSLGPAEERHERAG
jgi:hypothetical protein